MALRVNIRTFAWVWLVSIIFIYADAPAFAPDTSALVYFVPVAFVVSIPIAIVATMVIVVARQRLRGTRFERRLEDRQSKIALGIGLGFYLMAHIGLHIVVYAHQKWGRILVFASIAGGIATIAGYWLFRLIRYADRKAGADKG